MSSLTGSIQFLLCAVIFGSSWIAIRYQVADLGYIWPVSMRFLLAGIILTLTGILRKKIRLPRLGNLILISILMYGVNFILIYAAASYLKSGLNSLVCAMVIFFNSLCSGIFLKHRVEPPQLLAALLGMAGLSLVLSASFSNINGRQDMITGVILGLGGALVTSLGQILFVKMREAGDEILSVNAFGMLTGSLLLAIYEWSASGIPSIPHHTGFYLSLLFLALFPTALGFLMFHQLIDKVGPTKASYVFIMAPAIAMAISSVAESYTISLTDGAGFFLIFAGFRIITNPSVRAKVAPPPAVSQEVR